MSKVSISIHTVGSPNAPVCSSQSIASQVLTSSGESQATTTAVSPAGAHYQDKVWRIANNGTDGIHVNIGATPVATTSDPIVPAGACLPFTVDGPSHKVAILNVT